MKFFTTLFSLLFRNARVEDQSMDYVKCTSNVRRTIKSYFSLAVFMVVISAMNTLSAQSYFTISGPTLVTVGDYTYYSAQFHNNGGVASEPPGEAYPWWDANDAEINGGYGNASITWLKAGYNYVQFSLISENDGWSGFLNVTVAPPAPQGSASVDYNCSAILTRSQEPPPEYDWYWQSSSSGTSTNLGSATQAVVDAPGSYYLRARDKESGIWSINSQYMGTVTLYAVAPGEIACTGDPNICYNSSPPPMVSIADAVGQGPLYYQWQYYNGVAYVDIAGATGASYSPGPLTSSMVYRRAAISCNTIAYSDPLAIYVFPVAVGGNVTGGREAYGTATGALTLEGYSGSIIKWQQRQGTGAWTDIANTSTTYFYNNTTQTTSYRAQVGSSYCPTVESAPAVVTIYNVPQVAVNGPAAIPYSGTTTLTTGSYHSYAWFRNGNAVPGATQSSLLVREPGSYHVQVKGSASAPAYNSQAKVIEDVISTQNLNYIRSVNILKEGLNENSSFHQLEAKDLSHTIQYFDGLGRPMQTVMNIASPQQKDVVQPVVYDAFGREHRRYLPFVSNEADGTYKPDIIDGVTGDYTGIAASFYNNPAGRIADDGNKPFAETMFETSPLNRVLKQGAPGAAWQPNSDPASLNDHTIKARYAFNTASTVLRWEYDRATHLVKAKDAGNFVYYAPNELTLTTTYDEHGNRMEQYTDKQGNVVLKKAQVTATQYAQTYYIYDDFNDLVCVLTPEGVKRVDTEYHNATVLDQELFLAKWAYRYRYNGRKQVIETQVPGAQPVVMVYDKRNRLVLSQDGNQKEHNQWSFIKYDTLNRPVITGLYNHGSNIGQQAMTALVSTTKYCEAYNGVAAAHGYTNHIFPTQNIEVLSVTYYDNYDAKALLANTAFNYKHDELQNQETAPSGRTQLLATGTKTKMLGTSQYLWTINYYDDRSRLIQVVTDNSDGLDRITSVYDFAGKVVSTKTTHKKGSGAEIPVTRRFVYDHAGRVKETWHKTSNRAEVLLAKNTYNELSQLVTKQLHSEGPASKQAIAYDYNIRGWLKNINDPSTTGSALFSMQLGYNEASANVGTAQYNGNISEIIWQGAGTDKQSYAYYYDTLNRLKEAQYFNLSSVGQNGRYNEIIGGINARGYDLNGNIVKLKRYGKNGATSFGLMDNLTYHYEPHGNKLQRVDDAISANAFEEGFKELNNGSTDYEYDANGNMTRDRNKGIDSIKYNVMNLVRRVKKSSGEYIIYTYDAAGRKLKQQVYNASGPVKKTQYLGEFVYEDDALRFITHDEGRVVSNITAGAPLPWEYQYFLKDHLGNVRVTFSEQTTTTEYKATLENNTQSSESSTFGNYGNRSALPLFDHTDAGTTYTYSQLLTSGNNSQIGLAKSFEVNPGDAFDLEVYAKYEAGTGPPANVNNLFGALAGVFSLNPSGGVGLEGQGAYNAFNGLFGLGPYIGDEEPFEDGAAPKAFLNYILFDENFNLVDFGFDQVSAAAAQAGVSPVIPHDYLSLHIKVEKKGYLYVYLSNEQPVQTNVYFDDLKIVRNTGLQQSQDYYPFGLTFNSYQRESPGVIQDYLYNGKERQDELSLGWHDYGARMYLNDIGRWSVIDPLSDLFTSVSPYAYALNRPSTLNDVEGLLPGDPKYSGSGNVVIIIADNNHIDFNMWQSATESLHDTGWDYGVFNSFEEANEWIGQTYENDNVSINNLIIRTHGYVGSDELQHAIADVQNKAFIDSNALAGGSNVQSNSAAFALTELASNMSRNGKIVFTACGGSQLGNHLANALFKKLNGKTKNLTIYTNGSLTRLLSKQNKIKVRQQINYKLQQWKPWSHTDSNGTRSISSVPGLNENGLFMFFSTTTSSKSSQGSKKKLGSIYHPHKFKGKE